MSVATEKEYVLGRVLSREKDSNTYAASIKDHPGDFRVRRIFSAAADRMKADRATNIIDSLKGLYSDRLLPVVDSYILNNEESHSRDLCIVYQDKPGTSLAVKVGENSFEPELTGGMPALELPDVMDLFFSVVAALEYLHSNNTPHMDLSPDSIFIPLDSSPSAAVMVNYGLTDIISSANSFEFAAPEVHKRESLLPAMQYKVDIWAVSKCCMHVCQSYCNDCST
jgi:serine/threonine protein kinase